MAMAADYGHVQYCLPMSVVVDVCVSSVGFMCRDKHIPCKYLLNRTAKAGIVVAFSALL